MSPLAMSDQAIEDEMFSLLVRLADMPSGNCLGRRIAVARLQELEVERAERRTQVLDLRSGRRAEVRS